MKNYTNNKALKLKILNIIRNEGPCTKQKIAIKLSLNITTISNLINNLCKDSNLLIEMGDANSSGGRKPRLYQINEKIGYIVGINIGSKNTIIIISSLLGNIISSLIEKTDFEKNGDEIIDQVVTLTNKLILETNINKKDILGFGVGVSGCIDARDGYILFCPYINGLKDLPLKSILESKFNSSVFIDDSVRCMAVAEKKFGFGKDYNNFIFVGIGKGIGSGIYIDGKIYRGDIGAVGEIGHVTVKEDGPVCSCGNRGCLEIIASETGIIRRAFEGIENGIHTSISPDNVTVESISKAAEEGDKFAYDIINKTGEYIGIAISTELNLFGSDLVVLGGSVSKSGEILFSAINRTIKLRALNAITKRVKIIRTELDRRIPAIGAAVNITDELFENSSINIIDKIGKLKRAESIKS